LKNNKIIVPGIVFVMLGDMALKSVPV